MRGEEVRAFVSGLRSRFPDLVLTNLHSQMLDSLEREYRGQDVSFVEIVSVLGMLAGRQDSSSADSIYRRRVTELERSLAKRDAEYRTLHTRFHELQRGAARPEAHPPNELAASQLARLRGLVSALLKATQLLSRDRSELVEHLSASGGTPGLSSSETARRLGRESELIQVYQQIMERTSEPLPAEPQALVGCRSLLCNRTRPVLFVLYTATVWLLGVASCVLAGEYIGALAYLYMAAHSIGAVY